MAATLRGLRAERNMKQSDLATASGICQSQLSRMERGLTLPNAYEVRCLAAALNVELSAFYTRCCD